MKIGILGGTFDPPHYGHLKLAEAAIEALDLDEVILLPANINPFKQKKRITSAKDRIAMVQLMQKNGPALLESLNLILLQVATVVNYAQ